MAPQGSLNQGARKALEELVLGRSHCNWGSVHHEKLNRTDRSIPLPKWEEIMAVKSVRVTGSQVASHIFQDAKNMIFQYG